MSTSATSQLPSSGFEAGIQFPRDLSFPAVDGGEPKTIADFAGQKLVLHIFASW
ncbi:MAG: hypothetical protein HKN21_06850 [Candidatus Eisenbacteria bacterium]|uniref:Redoxin domain-containing protein n=1 Tax=Eiseniibacteriota bacterium TaxID=2212470 RepID=A0A7Y2E793_UNCEI|nr:hypothetical protein [Candidatus Eisenbacteria bacterium]